MGKWSETEWRQYRWAYARLIEKMDEQVSREESRAVVRHPCRSWPDEKPVNSSNYQTVLKEHRQLLRDWVKQIKSPFPLEKIP